MGFDASKDIVLRYIHEKKALSSFSRGGSLVARNDSLSEATCLKPRPTDGLDKRQVQPKLRIPTPAVVLDMGEASREQGFRLNGCR